MVTPNARATDCEISRPLSITVTATMNSATSTTRFTLGVARTMSAKRRRIASVWSQLTITWNSSGTTMIDAQPLVHGHARPGGVVGEEQRAEQREVEPEPGSCGHRRSFQRSVSVSA